MRAGNRDSRDPGCGRQSGCRGCRARRSDRRESGERVLDLADRVELPGKKIMLGVVDLLDGEA